MNSILEDFELAAFLRRRIGNGFEKCGRNGTPEPLPLK
jgi:hypothetical protein